MKIVRREQVWIHTHFLTNCTYLPDHHAREIRRKTDRLLDELGIVLGIHFDSRGNEGLRVVLECSPLPETMKKIEAGLAEILGPIPARPRKTEVAIEPPNRRLAPERRH